MKRATCGMIPWAALAMLCCGGAIRSQPASAQESRTVLIRAQHVHLGDGKVLSPGSVLVSDGKIVNVAESQPAPEGAETLEVEHLMPGLVDAYAAAGSIVANDAEITREVTAEFSLAGAIDWTARDFGRRLAEGVTTLHLAPGTDNVFSGLSTIVKTSGQSPQQRTVQDNAALVISVCSDPAQRNQARSRPDSIYVRQPTNRMGVVWIVRSQLHKAKLAAEADVAPLSGSLRVMQQALTGDTPVFAVSRTHYDMRALFSIAQEFGISPVVIGGEESWRIVDELAEHHASVILGPLRPGQENGPERARLCATTAQRLMDAGVPVCLSGADLLDQARFAVRYGMAPESALCAVTDAPARILGQESRMGSIASGKDADLIALQGPPLEFTSGIQWVMVDGNLYLAEADQQ